MVTALRGHLSFERPAVYAALLSVGLTLFAVYFGKAIFAAAAVLIAVSVFLIIKRKFTAAAVILICFVLSLNLGSAVTKSAVVRSFYGKTVSATLVVTEDSEAAKDYSVFSAKCVSGELPGGTALEPIYFSKTKLYAGDIITADIKISKIPEKQRKSFLGDGVYVYADAKNISKTGQIDGFYSFLGSLRRYIVKEYHTYLKGDTAALLVAVTTGNKKYLSDSLRSDIKTAGVSHMVAVSGFHLAVLLGNLFLLFDRVVKNRFARFAVSLVSVIIIAGVCGFSKSVLRAGAMYLISAAAPLFNRDSDSLSSLFISIPAVFLISPFALYSIGFNLSVTATFSIIYISPFFLDRLEGLPLPGRRFVLPFLSIVVNSFFAALFTTPILIKAFGTVSTVSVFANLFLCYTVTLALITGAAALVVSAVSGVLSSVLFYAAGFCSDVMIFIIKGLAQLPFAAVRMGNTGYYASLAAVAAVTALVYFTQKIKKEGDKSLCR